MSPLDPHVGRAHAWKPGLCCCAQRAGWVILQASDHRSAAPMSRNSPDFPVKPDTAWRRTLAAADRAALRALARGWPLERVLTIICTAMERLIDGSACSVLLLDDDGKLRHGAAPHLPQAYNTAIDGLEIGPSVGSCGTAAYTGRQVVVEDIRESPLWADYRDIAETARPVGSDGCTMSAPIATGMPRYRR